MTHPMAMDATNHERCRAIREKLSKEHEARLEELMSWTVFNQPFFAHLLMAQLVVVPTKSVPIAATDSFSIFINPETFFKYNIRQQAFILCHETLHCVFNDPILMQNWLRRGFIHINGKDFKAFADLINICMDYIINAQLIEAGVGEIPPDCLYDRALSARGMEAMVDLYEQLYQEPPTDGGGGGGQPGNGPGQKGFDFLMAPEADEETGETKERDQMDWQQTVAAAAQAALAQGKLPGSLMKLIGEIIDPKVDWTDHLRATIMRVNGTDSLDWTQPDRRMISRSNIGYEDVFFARTSGFGCGTIVIGYDSSGSMIGDETQQRLFSELYGIFSDLNPRELIVMFCDAAVHRVDAITEIEELETVRTEGVPGGGGTDFRPVFKEIEKRGLEPDMLIYLTDLYGSFPSEEPSYPVIWGSITDMTAPFGETVHIEL